MVYVCPSKIVVKKWQKHTIIYLNCYWLVTPVLEKRLYYLDFQKMHSTFHLYQLLVSDYFPYQRLLSWICLFFTIGNIVVLITLYFLLYGIHALFFFMLLFAYVNYVVMNLINWDVIGRGELKVFNLWHHTL